MSTKPVIISSQGTTTSDVRQTLSSASQPSPEVLRRGDAMGRLKRRVFIGPMPVQVVPAPLPPAKRRASRRFRRWSIAPSLHREGTDLGINLDNIDDDHAFRFFLSRGGREEDWTQETDLSTRREMVKKWRENSWAAVRARARLKSKSKQPAPAWVGSTFEIGDINGVGLPVSEPPASFAASGSSSANGMIPPTPLSHAPPVLVSSPASEGATTSYFTANDRSQLDLSSDASPNDAQGKDHRMSSSSNTPLLQPPNGVPRSSSSPDHTNTNLLTPSSSKPISETRTEGALKVPGSHSVLGLKSALKSRFSHSPKTITTTKDRGREHSKSVTFPQHAEVSGRESQPEPAANPSDVLLRTGSDLNYTSAGAAKSKPSLPSRDAIVLRDRLLVRVAKTRQEVRVYDEDNSRNITDLVEEKWQEFLVVWRRERLELYDDHRLPGKEFAIGRKHLAFIVPLTPPTTKFSLFSFTDMSFCLTCPPTEFELGSHRLLKFFHRDRGTHIFIFKHKSRSRAADWSWNLWRNLRGEDPGSIVVHVPALDTKIHIDVPAIALEGTAGWRSMTPHKVVSMCHEALSRLRDFDYLIATPMREGRELGLAWRRGYMLDWIWLLDDINGDIREWAVVSGLAFKNPGMGLHLELRLPEYMPTRIALSDGSKLEEPAAIEGYIWRIKPNSQSRSLTYLAIHDGYIFICPTSKTFLPQPPAAPDEDIHAAAERSSIREEQRRGTAQILAATSVIDLRNIILVRRATQATVVATDPRREQNMAGSSSQSIALDQSEEVATASDNEDLGGDEGLLNAALDKGQQAMRRSFELVMRTGYVIRFESYSRGLVVEWVTRLRALASYWTRRHRVDARLEMELLYACSGLPRFELNKLDDRDHALEAPPDPDDPSPYLSTFWNFSTLFARRPIIKSGRGYIKKESRGPYKLMQLVLVNGHLIFFTIESDNKMNAYHWKRTVNLVDAYICSGLFAMKALDTTAPNSDIPRRYQDGLECIDGEDETIFLIWHIPHSVDVEHKDPHGSATASYPQHDISAKRNSLIVRARSRLERDAWCWAINAEIERLVRHHRDRERRMRDAGGLVKSRK